MDFLPEDIFSDITIWAGFVLFLLMIPALWRVIKGPTTIDRIVAVNIIGTKTAVLLVIIGQKYKQVDMFVDFALAYALLNFIGSLAASRFLHKNNDKEGSRTQNTKPVSSES